MENQTSAPSRVRPVRRTTTSALADELGSVTVISSIENVGASAGSTIVRVEVTMLPGPPAMTAPPPGLESVT